MQGSPLRIWRSGFFWAPPENRGRKAQVERRPGGNHACHLPSIIVKIRGRSRHRNPLSGRPTAEDEEWTVECGRSRAAGRGRTTSISTAQEESMDEAVTIRDGKFLRPRKGEKARGENGFPTAEEGPAGLLSSPPPFLLSLSGPPGLCSPPGRPACFG